MLFYCIILRLTCLYITYENIYFALVRHVRHFYCENGKFWRPLKGVFLSCFLTILFFSPCFLSNSLFHSFLFSVPLFLHLLSTVLLPASLPYFLLLLQFLYVKSIALEIHCLVVSVKQCELVGIQTHRTDYFITRCERVSVPAVTFLDKWSDKFLCPVELVSCADPMTYSSQLLECQTSSGSWIRKWLLEQYWHASLSWLSVWGREIL
jgi:hypothetical protein